MRGLLKRVKKFKQVAVLAQMPITQMAETIVNGL